MTPWQMAITQMHNPHSTPPLARDDRDERIYNIARSLIAASPDGRVRMAKLIAEAGFPAHRTTTRIYSNDQFEVTRTPGRRELWVSMAAPRRGRA